MRDFLRQFMLYSRGERRAVVALAILIVIVILIPRAYHFYYVPARVSYRDTIFEKQLTANSVDTNEFSLDKNGSRSGSDSLFYFDPNTANIDDWIRLGASEKQAASIKKYLAKGNKFRRPDDLRKIYVLNDELKDKLVPYVRIKYGEDAKDKEKAEPMYSIEINSADSSAFESLYGIGPYRASKIIHYRMLLGGFYSVQQISEIRNLPDSVFQMIKPHLKVDPSKISQIDINSADFGMLRKHPYIHKRIAQAIIDYRNFNGRFESLDEIRKINAVTETEYDKIYPYLRIGE
jgi:competence protein ComEA